jgi:hypothetical protein
LVKANSIKKKAKLSLLFISSPFLPSKERKEKKERERKKERESKKE